MPAFKKIFRQMFLRKQDFPGVVISHPPEEWIDSKARDFALIEELERRAGIREFLRRRGFVKREYRVKLLGLYPDLDWHGDFGKWKFQTKVTSCKPANFQVVNEGKKEKLKGFEIILEDTILFPEGGGQPDDRGTINDVEVLKITRQGGDSINYTTKEVSKDEDVVLKVDWTRRFDHMVQHSGQHLITALATSMFGYNTTSWNLGAKTSFIELDTPSMSQEEIVQLESACNQKIRECISMFPTIYTDKDDPAVVKARSRGLPDDHVGPVRIVTIEGIDENLCCGTHVSNLCHLQSIKLLNAEKGKKKNTIYLNFVVGDRVLQYLGRLHDVERTMTTILKGPLEQHTELAEKAVKGFKATEKACNSLLKDLAILETQHFKMRKEKDDLFVFHRKEADDTILNLAANEMSEQGVMCFLTCGEDKGTGMFVLSGDEKIATELGPKVAELLEGKGFLLKGRYKGKCSKLTNRVKAEKLIREHLQQLKTEKSDE